MNEIETLIYHSEHWNFDFFLHRTIPDAMSIDQSEEDMKLLEFMKFVAQEGHEVCTNYSEVKRELNQLKGTIEILKQKIGELVFNTAELEAENKVLDDSIDYYKAER